MIPSGSLWREQSLCRLERGYPCWFHVRNSISRLLVRSIAADQLATTESVPWFCLPRVVDAPRAEKVEATSVPSRNSVILVLASQGEGGMLPLTFRSAEML